MDTPSTLSDNTITTVITEKKKFPLSWMLFFLSFLLNVILVLSGLWYVSQNGTPSKNDNAVVEISNVSVTPVVSTASSVEPKHLDSLQKIIADHCSEERIKVSDLPFKIDQTVIAVDESKGGAYCLTGEANGSQNLYISIPLESQGELFFFDDASVELGHGGVSSLRPGKLQFAFPQSQNRFTFYIRGSEGPSLVGQTDIGINGRKEFTASNGNKIFVTYSKTGIKGDDTRLVAFFNKHITTENGFENEIEYTPTIDSEVQNLFFSPIKEGTPEYDATLSLDTFLNAITAK